MKPKIFLFDFWNVLAFANKEGNDFIFNKTLIEFIGQLTIPCHVFSNSNQDFLEQLKPQLIPPFSSVISAKQIGLSKSDPASYAKVCTLLNYLPAEVIFIDDQYHNIEAAKLAGLQTILFESTDQLIRKATKLLV